jgi:DNA polymerase-3 subunit delta
MPATAVQPARPVVLVCGEDEFAVKRRAREIFQQWSGDGGGFGDDTIDGTVSNCDEALQALARLREALHTLPFFGNAKVVWLRDCNFLGDDRVSTAQDLTAALAEFAEELRDFDWSGVRLLISAAKVDKRRVFYKALDKIGSVESFAGWSADDRDWVEQAEFWARKELRDRKKEITEDALATLIASVGPHPRLLAGEVEKVCLYVGDRSCIEAADVTAICTRNKTARAFALADALGERKLPELVRRLDEELWNLQFDKSKSEIGLLYGLISKVRAMLFAKEMLREGWLRPESDFPRFKAQLARVPADKLPADRRFNPLALHPFVLHKALAQSRNYSSAELIRAMHVLLECNRRLVASGLEESLVLQQALAQIVGTAQPAPPAAA